MRAKNAMRLGVLTLLFLGACAIPDSERPSAHPAAAATPSREDALALLPERERARVSAAFDRAGANAPQLASAIVRAEPESRPGVGFLIATMPARDAESLDAAFLIENVELAYAAWRGAPWGHEIDEATFFRYVLPYVNLNERRDDWRRDFVRRFQQEAWRCTSPAAATKWLNDHLNDAIGVHYHASKREKPDQSPYESMELGYASCTGLSILLADACRACGIPARLAGCPAWKVIQGNHTWVEVFVPDENGQWRWFNVGDTGSDPRGENWVNERCRKETDPDDWAHAVWAAPWTAEGLPAGQHFPLCWEWEIDYVPGLNVTRFYTAPSDVTVTLPKPGPATVEARCHGDLVARVRVPADATTASLRLANGEEFEIRALYANGTLDSWRVTPAAE